MRGVSRRQIVGLALVLLLSVAIEALVCNCNAFRVLNRSKYEEKVYGVEDLAIEGFKADGNVLTRDDLSVDAAITIEGIDTCVGTIYLELGTTDRIQNYTIYYTDEASAQFHIDRTAEREYVQGAIGTQYVTCHLNGKTQKLRFTFDMETEDKQVIVYEIRVNKAIPWVFSKKRWALIFVIMLFLYLIGNSTLLIRPAGAVKRSVAFIAIYALFVGITFSLYQHAVVDPVVSYQKGDVYSQSLTDALISGHLYLNEEPRERFMKLDNPYDYTQRRHTRGKNKWDAWDAAYYDGHFYVYFGVVPALLFFVPFKLITGSYLMSTYVVTVAACLFMLFLGLIWMEVLARQYPDLPLGLVILSLIVLNCSTGAFFYAAIPKFYCIAYTCGYAFAALGYLIFVRWWYRGRRGRLPLLFGALCLALAVGCRPTMLLLSLPLVPFAVRYLKECGKNAAGFGCFMRGLRWNWLGFVLFAVPYAAVGAGLMWYNYERFGSILQFGQSYQLTVTDMLHSHAHISTLPRALWIGLLQPLAYKATFPFVEQPDISTSYVGFYYAEATGGSLPALLPTCLALLVPGLWKRSWAKRGRTATLTAAGLALLGLVIAIFNFLTAGVHWRYIVEFTPLMSFAALLLLCNNADWVSGGTDKGICEQTKGLKTGAGSDGAMSESADNATREQTSGLAIAAGTDGVARERRVRTVLHIAFAVALYTLAVYYLLSLRWEGEWILDKHPEYYYTLKYLWCFWM